MDDRKREPEIQSRMKRVSIAFLALAAVLMLLIMAASWAPDSRMTTLRWVPGWIAALADRDPNMRTAVPFLPLAFLLALGLTWRGVRWPLAGTVVVSGLCLGLSEFGQNFVPHRTADVKDLMWGGIGIFIGTGMAWISSHWRRS